MSTSTVLRTIARIAAAAVISGAIAVGVAAPASAAPQDCAYMGYGSAPDTLGLKHDATEQKLANMINTYRAQNGRPALRTSTGLARPTMWVSIDSARRGQSPANHIDTRGMGIAQRAQFCSGYTGAIGEINYWGHGGAGGNYFGSAEAAFAWWKQSPGHNALMLSTQHSTFSVGRAYMGHNAERQHWTVSFGTS